MKNVHLIFVISVLFIFGSCKQKAVEMESQRIAEDMILPDSLAKVQEERQKIADREAEKPTLANDIKLNTKTPSDKKLVKTAELRFRVGNVWNSTERIEDLAAKYNGYITYSNLQNKYQNYSESEISKDSLLILREILVENSMKLRIPNIKLDSFIRELTPFVKYLDYRIIKIDDVTFQYVSIAKKGDRFKNYEQRQTTHIDSKDSKLKDASAAEDNLFERQLQADEIALQSQILADKLKYCDMTLEIYQKPIITKEIVPDFKSVSSSRPNFFIRFGDAIVQGYRILEEIILFLFRIWGIILVGIAVYAGIMFIVNKANKK
jgi:hypothetical protein